MNDAAQVPSEAVPHAETLDEATLRQLFPNAPAQLAVPKDVGSMFGARMRTLGGDNNLVLRIGWVSAFVLALIVALAGSPIGGAVIAGIAALVSIGIALWQHSSAADEFFDRYAAARGLSHVEGGSVQAGVPLCGKGDKRKWPRVLSGNILGQQAQVAHYTYTEISTDSEGNRTETDYDFTTCVLRLPDQVAARFDGVYLAPRSFSFGALQDKLAHDRGVKLESAEFHKRYSLRVVDSQDDIALYELFSTPFVHLLATGPKVYWEQRGSDLVCWHKGHEDEAADLDSIVQGAAIVYQRYLEEWR